MPKQAFFDSIQVKAPGRNKFDLSHDRKMSFGMGLMIPFFCMETLPGDSIRTKSSIFARFQPLLAPIMHRVNVTTHYFKVPYRLIWEDSEDFFTGGREGTTAPVPPTLTVNAATNALFGTSSLADYLGVPTLMSGAWGGNSLSISALPFRAYQLIYNEYYRDQNLTPELAISKASGAIGAGAEMNMLTAMRTRAWRKDYFTSALPFAQRGPEVLVPMDAVAKAADGDIDYSPTGVLLNSAGGIYTSRTNLQSAGPGDPIPGALLSDPGAQLTNIANIEEVRARNASITIADLRRAKSLQEFVELLARVGGRYVEYLKGVFGVQSDDARLQRPEYLGGGVQNVMIQEIDSTYQDPALPPGALPQGNMSGKGIAIGDQNGFSTYCKEHCIIMGILTVTPEPAYQQGLDRMWSRETRYDYYHPQFAHIGEQEVKLKELYINPAAPADFNATFGYQSRFCEYKYIPSTVHGDMRNNLKFWHLGRIFETKPELNQQFIECDPDTRIFAVPSDSNNNLIGVIHNKVDAIRPIPYFSTPKF